MEKLSKQSIQAFLSQFNRDLKDAHSSKKLEEVRVKYLGRKGVLSSLMQHLKEADSESRPQMGKWINAFKDQVEHSLEKSFKSIQKREILEEIESEKVDVFLPGRKNWIGRQHPISNILDRMIEVLSAMGFSVFDSSEIEGEYYNYGSLNYPAEHPARDMQDTFYLDHDHVLRSHTTSFQKHVMEKYSPPIRMMTYGKCYRNEEVSTRSHILFHQVDVMYIDRGVTIKDLLSSLQEFYVRFFEKDVELRIRASFFPFVTPGLEVDVKCLLCKGSGCRLCNHNGWLEICGAGMIHTRVLQKGGIDPDVFSGFAWGGGVERLFLMLHKVSDIRLFLENDMRFLEQFT